MAISERPALAEAQAALAEEWRASNPTTPEAVAAFYRDNQGQADDLAAWHATPDRQAWTEALVYVAKQIGAKSAVDIGCGIGRDLAALREAYPAMALAGVEPNRAMLATLAYRFDPHPMFADVRAAPVETADLLVCFDVLEHVVDPEQFLGSIARRAKPNAVLVETTATFDIANPLHLEANWGWHPGHCLEAAGWTMIDSRGRLRVWQRMAPAATARAALLLCAYRACSIPTMQSIIRLTADGWRFLPKWGDALISRSRSAIVSQWHAETADDVFLMVDDDLAFDPKDAERLVALAREKRSIACAAYPVGDGGHLAVRSFQGQSLEFSPEAEPVEIEYAATGFLACHRDVIDALAPTLTLCHPEQSWGFRYYFLPMVADMELPGGLVVPAALSEDWAFSHRALQAGFSVWLDPSITLGHQKQVEISVRNMSAMHAAIQQR